tara:strand:- start:118 stop:399 length:282 start_codon:yes stop_codon:yes gene_type:complete
MFTSREITSRSDRPQDKALALSLLGCKHADAYELAASTPYHVIVGVNQYRFLMATFQFCTDAIAYAQKVATSGEFEPGTIITIPAINHQETTR